MATQKNQDSFIKPEMPLLPHALGNENPLSEREMEVAQLLATGASNAEIARQLVISPHTVKVHLRNVFEKLQASSRTEASMILVQRGWLTVHGVDVTPNESSAPPPPPPDPEPLADQPAILLPWQRFYLIGAFLLCLLALLAPNLRAYSRNSPELLSDAGRTILGKPVVQLQPRWEAYTPLNNARSRLAIASAADHLYVFGGEADAGRDVAEVDAYDLRVNVWRAVSPMPEALANLAATTFQQRIYIAGGSNNGATDTTVATVHNNFWAYDPVQDHWENLGALPHPLAGAVLTTDQKTLYLLGGWDGQAMHDEVWRFVPGKSDPAPGKSDPASGKSGAAQWELVTRIATPRAFFGATIVNGEIYVIGGYDGKRELDLAAAYSISDNAWRDLPSLSTPRGGLSVVYDGVAIYALGGGWTRPLETHERFDAVANLWSNFPSPLQGEWRHFAAVSYNDRIHMIGGWSGDYLETHLAYQSSFRALLPVISND